jgi:hypothetical protein
VVRSRMPERSSEDNRGVSCLGLAHDPFADRVVGVALKPLLLAG